ncbi:hypothetical protein [Ligilactobacillus equi]|uniref:Uncharacterized protein n=1 Tax=Ligilactobacillus equi DPC 6820 TaxID=1392007 RepID=V7HXM2_9LACO|nr:hypothetical protein [Ligilactobacillus equi]ETA73786.1 hypothetical protein LEQ_0089c [Ligilactobacillus equi DPC 6820]
MAGQVSKAKEESKVVQTLNQLKKQLMENNMVISTSGVLSSWKAYVEVRCTYEDDIQPIGVIGINHRSEKPSFALAIDQNDKAWQQFAPVARLEQYGKPCNNLLDKLLEQKQLVIDRTDKVKQSKKNVAEEMSLFNDF